MKGRKIITISIIMNLILVGMFYNLISKVNVNNKKQIIKEMTESKQVSGLQTQLDTLNESHEEYARNVQSYKKQIASAITDMGVNTSYDDSFETMANNIKTIKGTANSDFYKVENGSLVIGNTYLAVIATGGWYDNCSLNCDYTVFWSAPAIRILKFRATSNSITITNNGTGAINASTIFSLNS